MYGTSASSHKTGRCEMTSIGEMFPARTTTLRTALLRQQVVQAFRGGHVAVSPSSRQLPHPLVLFLTAFTTSFTPRFTCLALAAAKSQREVRWKLFVRIFACARTIHACPTFRWTHLVSPACRSSSSASNPPMASRWEPVWALDPSSLLP